MASSNPKRWTAEEDERLRLVVYEQLAEIGTVRDWNRVASALPGRTNKDSRKRWAKIAKEVNKGAWDTDEDERLEEAVRTYGTRWTQVAEHVGSRHADQCAKRWTHSLDPLVDRSEWSTKDDERLFKAVHQRGHDWRAIADNEFPGRSTLAIKNRYQIVHNRSKKSSAGSAESPALPPTSTPSYTSGSQADQSHSSMLAGTHTLRYPYAMPGQEPAQLNGMSPWDFGSTNSVNPQSMAVNLDDLTFTHMDNALFSQLPNNYVTPEAHSSASLLDMNSISSPTNHYLNMPTSSAGRAVTYNTAPSMGAINQTPYTRTVGSNTVAYTPAHRPAVVAPRQPPKNVRR